MALMKILARDMDCFVNTGTTAVPVWTQIDYTQVTANYSVTNADTTTQSDGGWSAHLPALRSATFSMEGRYLVDPATGDRDVAQAFLESAAHLVSHEGLIQFWFVMMGRGTGDAGADTPLAGLKFSGSLNATPFGGGTSDAAAFNCEVTMSGKPDLTDGTHPTIGVTP